MCKFLSEINAGFFYSNAEQREKMVSAERRQVDERVMKIIELKNKAICLLCPEFYLCYVPSSSFMFCSSKKHFNYFLHMQVCSGSDKNFVVINQKGIDPPSLDLLARAGVSKL
jgi:T-complex protein 1 subunit zeta